MTEDKKDSNERYIKNLDKHIDIAREASNYSIVRFDILIITLSTSALALTIGYVNNINYKTVVNIGLLKISWVFFVIPIVLNLLSQVSAYYANEENIKILTNKSRLARGKSVRYNNKCIECCKCILDKITITFNIISLFSLITGIILVLIFFYNNY